MQRENGLPDDENFQSPEDEISLLQEQEFKEATSIEGESPGQPQSSGEIGTKQVGSRPPSPSEVTPFTPLATATDINTADAEADAEIEVKLPKLPRQSEAEKKLVFAMAFFPDHDSPERQMMREAFDRRLRELQSPWLSVGKDSKDEVIQGGDYYDLCQKCMDEHDVTVETAVIAINELSQVELFCDGYLDALEVLDETESTSSTTAASQAAEEENEVDDSQI